MSQNPNISFSDFLKVDIRYGKIIEVNDFPKVKKPAYQLKIDFGSEIGIKQSSAQIVKNYRKEELIGKGILAVVNFEKKQIANFMSEVLVLGLSDQNGDIVLIGAENSTEMKPPLGSRMH